MKVRTGLVSNSSSSSFIIATKGELPKGKLKEVVAGALKVPEDSPLYFMAEEMADILSCANSYTLDELIDEMEYDSATDAFKYHPIIPKALSKGFNNFAYGSVSNEDGGTAEVLCNIGFNYEDDTILMEKENGY